MSSHKRESRLFKLDKSTIITLYLGSIRLTLKSCKTLGMHDSLEAVSKEWRMKVEDVKIWRAINTAPPLLRPGNQG